MYAPEPERVQPISALRLLRVLAVAVLAYVFLWSTIQGFLFYMKPGWPSDPVETVVMGGVYGFILLGGLAFLSLHLPLLMVMRMALPSHLVRFLPVLSLVVAGLLSGWLRYLYAPWLDRGDFSPFWIRFCASTVTALVSGFLLSLRPCEAAFSRAAVTVSVAIIVLCLAGFLYYTFVWPSHYHYDGHGYYRVDWLTGQEQEPVDESGNYRNRNLR